jgi:hypothetical protein
VPVPEIKIQDLDSYLTKIYGNTVAEGKIHLRIEGPGGYEVTDEVITASYHGNWEYVTEKLNAGGYRVRAYVFDPAVNKQSLVSGWKDFEIKMESPEIDVAIEGVSEKAKITGTAFPGGKVELTIFSQEGKIIQAEVRVDDRGDWKYMTDFLTPGKYSVYAYAFDKLSNKSDRSSTKNFEIARKPGTGGVTGASSGGGSQGGVQGQEENIAEGIPVLSAILGTTYAEGDWVVLLTSILALSILFAAMKKHFEQEREKKMRITKTKKSRI